MNTKVKLGILAFAICFIVGSVVYLVTIRGPAEKPTLTREQLLQAVENAKRGDREELTKIINTIRRAGTPGGIYVSKKHLPDFVSFLKEKDPQIQLLGAEGLHVLKSPKSKEPLSEYLKGKDFAKLEEMVYAGDVDERHAEWETQASSSAILTLGEIGDKSAIPILESLRSVKELHFEFGGGPVEEALAKLGAEGIRSLSNLGPEADHRQIAQAAGAIRKMRDPKNVPALIATVKDANCALSIRTAALGALGDMKDVDTLPFILATMTNTEYPKYVRTRAAYAAAKSRRPEAEEALLEMFEKPDCDIRVECLCALAILNPKQYLPVKLKIVLDKSAPLKEREKLASPFMFTSAERVKPHLELVREGLKAVKNDGSPADLIRVYMWKAYNKATGEEPPLEVMDDKLAYRKLYYDFKKDFRMRFIIEHNYDAPLDEIERVVNEKIKSIVVKWQPEKGGEKP